MRNKNFFALFPLFLLFSCSTAKHQVGCQSQLYSAFYAYQNAEYQKSLEEVKLAQKHAAHLKWENWCVIETYDDSGLYYYLTEDFDQSRIHQSIAVLLAYSSPSFAKLYQFYLTNLGRVYQKLGQETAYAEVRENPKTLLKDPAIKNNLHVKQMTHESE